jgi:hypothetical protein
MKPRMFVASSSKSRKLAHGIQANLDADTDVTCWDQGFFLPGTITLDALLTQAIEYDFGAFVFSPDDLVEMNSVLSSAVRDNVLFEFGLFAGKLGHERIFMLMPDASETPLHLPTDLAGFTGVTYREERLRQGDAVQAVLGAACQKIRTAIDDRWGESAILTPDLVLLLRYLDRDFNLWLTQDQYAKDIAVYNEVPEKVDKELSRAWRRAIRYGLMYLALEGLVRVRADTAVTYSITSKGRRLLRAPKIQQRFSKVFKEDLRPLSGHIWGD